MHINTTELRLLLKQSRDVANKLEKIIEAIETDQVPALLRPEHPPGLMLHKLITRIFELCGTELAELNLSLTQLSHLMGKDKKFTRLLLHDRGYRTAVNGRYTFPSIQVLPDGTWVLLTYNKNIGRYYHFLRTNFIIN